MKFLHQSFLVAAVTASSFSHAFAPPHLNHNQNAMATQPPIPSMVALQMSSDFQSDFASAMPEAPPLTQREFIEQSADKCISNIQGSLGEGVKPVPELDALQKLRENDAATDEQLSLAIYELMIERGMTYDEEPETGILTETDFDLEANLDVTEVKDEFFYLYRYGMSLISRGFCSVDEIKKVVEKRLISRTGKTPEEFDAWLGF